MRLTSKSGARHSASDMAQLQRAHDLCVELGAACQPQVEYDVDPRQVAAAARVTAAKLLAVQRRAAERAVSKAADVVRKLQRDGTIFFITDNDSARVKRAERKVFDRMMTARRDNR